MLELGTLTGFYRVKDHCLDRLFERMDRRTRLDLGITKAPLNKTDLVPALKIMLNDSVGLNDPEKCRRLKETYGHGHTFRQYKNWVFVIVDNVNVVTCYQDL
jgi:hypothetical protein